MPLLNNETPERTELRQALATGRFQIVLAVVGILTVIGLVIAVFS